MHNRYIVRLTAQFKIKRPGDGESPGMINVLDITNNSERIIIKWTLTRVNKGGTAVYSPLLIVVGVFYLY